MNYRKFQAWILHNLRVDPRLCGVKKSYDHFFKPEPPTVKPSPAVKLESAGSADSKHQVSVIQKRSGEPSSEQVAIRTNHKRRKLDPSPDMRREVAQESSHEASHQTSHQTSYLDTGTSSSHLHSTDSTSGRHFSESQTGLVDNMLVKVEQQRPHTQAMEHRPEQDMISKAEHDAVVVALKAEIEALRENEERLLTIGLSWKRDRDQLLKNAT